MTMQIVGKVGDGPKLAIIAICTLTEIQTSPYATHLQFAYRLAKDNPEFQFILFTPHRMTIANFRNLSVQTALQTKAEYLMFIDDDAVLINQSDLFKKLKDRDKHIIAPLMYVRGYPFPPMFFKYIENPSKIYEGKALGLYDDFKTDGKIQEDGLLEVAAIGCHTCLIKTEIFRAMQPPFFMTGMNNTEDVYFCMKCHDYIENIEIFVDTKLSVAHLLPPLWVDDSNVEMMKEFYEKMKLDGSSIPESFTKSQPDIITKELHELGEDFVK